MLLKPKSIVSFTTQSGTKRSSPSIDFEIAFWVCSFPKGSALILFLILLPRSILLANLLISSAKAVYSQFTKSFSNMPCTAETWQNKVGGKHWDASEYQLNHKVNCNYIGTLPQAQQQKQAHQEANGCDLITDHCEPPSCTSVFVF